MSDSASSTLQVRAPHDDSVIDEIDWDTVESIDGKISLARTAMREWAAIDSVSRERALLAVAVATEARLDDVVRLLSLEQGKTVKEARLELDRYLGALTQYAGLGTAAAGLHMRLGDGVTGLVERRPAGLALGIVPWNFPTSLFGTKLAPALAAGCGFLIKPAPSTAAVTSLLVDIARPALPDGLLDVVVADAVLSASLIEHDGVDVVAFTGSTEVGRTLAARMGYRLRRIGLELGGNDPIVVRADADLTAVGRAIMGTRFYNAGQVCVAPKRLIVARAVAKDLIGLLEAKIARVTPGPGLAEGSTMGPLHTASVRERLEGQVDDAVAHGGRLIGGGRPTSDETRAGWFVLPSLLVEPGEHARVRTEETFGPALSVLVSDDDDHAVELANESAYGLGASVWSADQDRAMDLADRIESGYCWVNTIARVYDELPFGGVKDSGYGREHGQQAIELFSYPRTVVVGSPGRRR